MADQVEISLPKTRINEKSGFTAIVRFRDRASASAAAPLTVSYKIFNVSTSDIVKDWTHISVAAQVSIAIDGQDNLVRRSSNSFERIELVVAADRGLSTQVIDSAEYQVVNLHGVRNAIQSDDSLEIPPEEIVTGEWILPNTALIKDANGNNRKIAFRDNIGRYITGDSALTADDADGFIEYAGAGGDSLTLLALAEAGLTVSVMNVGSGVLNIVEATAGQLSWLNGSTILIGDRVLSPGGVLTLKYDSQTFEEQAGAKCWGSGVT